MRIQAAVLVRPGEISIEHRLATPPAPGEVGVNVNYVGICGSDQAHFRGSPSLPRPVVPGHEFSGEICALGEGVTGLRIGQRVTAAPLITCGLCEYCSGDLEYLCKERRIYGVEVDGALRQQVNLPARTIFSLPDEVSLREGALLEPLAVAVHAVRRAGCLEGRRTLVIGAGAIGLLVAQVARARGSPDVTLMDVNPGRLNLAREMGFTVINSNQFRPDEPRSVGLSGWEWNLVFEASGARAAAHLLTGLIAPRGTVVVVGRFPAPVPLDLDTLLLKEACLITSRYFSFMDFRDALQLMAGGAVRVEPLIQGDLPFGRVAERQGAEVMAAASQAVRLLIDMRHA